MGGLDSSRASVQVIGNPGLLREGICAILKEMADVKCVERPRDLQDALAACEVCRPEILVIEDSPPQLDGLLAVDMFRQKCGLVQAILFSSAIGGALVKRAFKAIDFGATGYISTSDTVTEFQRLIRNSMNLIGDGSPVISSRIVSWAKHHYDRRDRNERVLTPREHQVLRLIAAGFTTKEVALRLSISPKTVESHRVNIMNATGLKSIAGLVRYAVDQGLV